MTDTTVKRDAVVEAVRADLHRRSQLGITKYGTTLAENPAGLRERLQHAYEEALDMANYLKWAMMQIDGENVTAAAENEMVIVSARPMPEGWRCKTWYVGDRVAWYAYGPGARDSACGSADGVTAAKHEAAEEAHRVQAWRDKYPVPGGDPVEEMRQRKDAAYEERNRVVAALAKLFPSGLRRTQIDGWDPEWHGCVYLDLPTGQVSWHYHDSHAHLFEGLPAYNGEWDGHDTVEKYRRLAGLWAAHNGQHPEITGLMLALDFAGRRFNAAKPGDRLALLDIVRALREMATGLEKMSGGTADPEAPVCLLEASREPVTLAECPVGLFLSEAGVLCLKTAYGDNHGRIDAYIVESGEFFWGGGPQIVRSQRGLLVRPVTAS